MTNEDLERMIRCYDRRQFPSYFALQPLSGDVILGYVWAREPDGSVANESSYKVYFVLTDGAAVGAVLDMERMGSHGHELHWLVLPEHRGQGYLHSALQRTIFPHMFSDGRNEQLTSARGKKEISYALRQGFETIDGSNRVTQGEVRLQLSSGAVAPWRASSNAADPLTRRDADELKSRLRRAKSLVQSVSEQLRCSYGADKQGYEELVHEIENAALDLTLEYEFIQP